MFNKLDSVTIVGHNYEVIFGRNEVIRNVAEKNDLKAYELVEMIQKMKE